MSRKSLRAIATTPGLTTTFLLAKLGKETLHSKFAKKVAVSIAPSCHIHHHPQNSQDNNPTKREHGAANNVFNISELVEMILLQTDMKTALLAQCISKSVHDAVSGSTKLQKKLFFIRPTYEEAIALRESADDTIVMSDNARNLMVLNKSVVKIEFPAMTGFTFTLKLAKGIVADTEQSARRATGSWTRMWFCSCAKLAQSHIRVPRADTTAIFYLDLKGKKVGGPDCGVAAPVREPWFWLEHKYDSGTVGEVLSAAEEDAWQEVLREEGRTIARRLMRREDVVALRMAGIEVVWRHLEMKIGGKIEWML